MCQSSVGAEILGVQISGEGEGASIQEEGDCPQKSSGKSRICVGELSQYAVEDSCFGVDRVAHARREVPLRQRHRPPQRPG
eukprot:1043707-Rhodomonas_salina.3